ncbi:MAG: cytochrome c oxidase assembly protein, partial [Kineosporiaceae bacterium]
GPAGTAGATLLALAALVPPALAGHSGSAANHETATTSLGLHLVGVSVWVGGLATLGLVRGRLGEAREAVVARYSGLALVAAGLVVVSGVLNASTRVTGISDLATPYGSLLVAKALLTGLLLAAGALHRRWTIRAMAAGRPTAFRRLLAGEVLVMAAVVGVAAALATTEPPVPTTEAPPDRTPGEILAGYPVPPAPDLAGWLTGWQPDALWLLLGGAAAAGYLAGYRRLRRRGDRWPVSRLVLFLAGIALLTWVTSGGPAVYGRWAFSTHMIQHMLLAMAVPVLLVAGAPILLALRTLQPRRDSSRGAREWLLAAVHSRWSRTVTHPVVAAAIFIVGMVAFYWSPLFELSLRTHLGHELMIVHFLASGYLFAWVLVGADPGARTIAYPFKILLLFATVAFHALFGVALGQGERLLAADWFAVVAADRPWGADLLADQRLGAAWAWGLGELPALVLAIAVAVQWARSDTREARRADRAADRDGDAALGAYNAYLARLAVEPSAPADTADGSTARSPGA